MRKLLWCCSVAGLLALGGMFSVSYYGYCNPDSMVGHCVITAASTSIALQPVSSVVAMVARASQHAMNGQETAAAVGGNEECIPEEPQPVAPEEIDIQAVREAGNDVQPEAAPIVIHEEEPLPQEVQPQVPATVDIAGLSNGPDVPDNVCPLVMPYCSDDEAEQPAVKPVMPLAQDDEQKPAVEESEDQGFKEWMKLFEEKESKSSPAEALPAPREEPQAEPKCQEDTHLHEHYSGCPHVTCPYTGKSYPTCPPATKSGKEESSEEPAIHHRVRKHSLKEKSKDSCPHTDGVDTMEYRPSDGGLNEYGRGPL
jgi:hypothetical protein